MVLYHQFEARRETDFFVGIVEEYVKGRFNEHVQNQPFTFLQKSM